MIDTYIKGEVLRKSPEAPVPILSNVQSEKRLGGAANVAQNLRNFEVETSISCIIGNDDNGRLLNQMLVDIEVNCSGLIVDNSRPTTNKTRFLKGTEHLLRVDEESQLEISETDENKVLESVRSLIKDLDLVIFQDYDKGVLSKSLIKEVIKLCEEHAVHIAVDPKKDHFWNYHNVSLFKPNLREVTEALNRKIDPTSPVDLKNVHADLQNELNYQTLLLTLSEYGVFIANKNDSILLPATERRVIDVSGAGDAVVTIASLGTVLGLGLQEIAHLANIVGGQACEVSGVMPINPQKFIAECLQVSA